MAYKPILAPQEFHEWLRRRAERLTGERGERVSMAEALRELPGMVDANEVVVQVTKAGGRAKAAQP